MTDPRGVRLNNPGNIRHGQQWQGLADKQPDPDFCTFKSPQWGIRAIARLILNYCSVYHLNTVGELISRWAPPNENDTAAYVKAVAAAVGEDPNVVVNVDCVAFMLPFVKAIIQHENGEQPYADAVIMEGLRLAGVSDAKPPPLAAQKAFVTHVASGAAVVAAGAAQYAPAVKSAADQLGDYTGISAFAHIHSVLLGIAGALVLAGIVAEILKHRAAA